jgi:hypothetical protein
MLAEPNDSLRSVIDMTSRQQNLWKTKATALDRYRWLLLRERHGFAGSVFRFFRDAVIDYCFGFFAKLRLTNPVDSSPCDFLLLQSAPRIIGLRRKKALISSLRERGYRLTETALPEHRDILAQRLLSPPPRTTPLRYYGYAAHAAWIVAHYQPRILLNDRNGSFYSPFLRLSLHQHQGTLVHLAHATTVESSRRLGMNDYDYYFLFGPSSLASLQARKLRFGTSTAVLTGSHMIDQSYDLPPPDPTMRTVLVLGVGPDREKEAGFQRTYALLKEWAARTPHYQVLVKRHPRSAVPFWQDAADSLNNVTVLPKELNLAQALERACCVVNIMSNAVIEAGLAGRPVLYCNLSDDRDIFDQETFFGRALRTPEEFQCRINEIEADFPAEIEKARHFALFHLAHGSQGLNRTCQALENLLSGKTLPDDIEYAELSQTV